MVSLANYEKRGRRKEFTHGAGNGFDWPTSSQRGREMSLTGPACEEGGKERGKKDPGFFLAPSVYLEVCSGI